MVTKAKNNKAIEPIETHILNMDLDIFVSSFDE